MFYENLVSLCAKHNTTPNAVCNALGLAESAATRWRAGSVPRDTTLKKIAVHFGVSVDDLLADAKEKDPIKQEEFDEANEFLAQIAQEIKSLDDEGRKELENYVAYLVSKKKNG